MEKFIVVLLFMVLAASGTTLFTTSHAHAQAKNPYTFDNALIVQHAIDIMHTLVIKDAKGNIIGYKKYVSPNDGQGDCWPFVRDVLESLGVTNIDNTGPANTDYFTHLLNAGGVPTPITDLQPGDIVQEGPNGGHTYIIVGFINREWYYVIDSNSDGNFSDYVKEYARHVLPTNDGGTEAFEFGATNVVLTNYAWYPHSLVKWNGDTNPQPASWVVSPWFKRYWIPDIGTYGCLRGYHWDVNGQPSSLPAATLDNLPDQWGAHAVCGVGNRLHVNQIMLRGTYINSQNSKFQLSLQADGNLVLYGLHGALWATNSWAPFMGYDDLVMQSDGNLVAYSVRTGVKPWASKTNGQRTISYLEVTNDGHLILYDAHRTIVHVVH